MTAPWQKGSLVLAALAASGCSEDPVYVVPPEALEVGAPDSMLDEATTMLTLPIRLERGGEATDRAELEAELGTMLPYINRDDLDVSLEWVVRNLGDAPGQAVIAVNGANEYFAYVPSAFVVDPDEEEEPPPLAGGIPIAVPAASTVSGVIREDELAEGALDLELITRGGLNPFAALLAIHEEMETFSDTAGAVIPIGLTANLIRLDISFSADSHMVMEYAVRVRDHRRPNLVHEEGLAADPGELTAFAPTDFVPVLE
jgi:hypothetical protein